jgi:hypothetical protein
MNDVIHADGSQTRLVSSRLPASEEPDMKTVLTVLILALIAAGAVLIVSKLERHDLAAAIQVDPRGMAPQLGATTALVAPHPAAQAWSMVMGAPR